MATATSTIDHRLARSARPIADLAAPRSWIATGSRQRLSAATRPVGPVSASAGRWAFATGVDRAAAIS